MASPPDPSEFAVAVAVAVGYAHVLDKVLGLLQGTSPARSPVVAVALAVPMLAAYLVVVTLAFAVRVAADGYAQIVACGGEDVLAARVATMSPAAILGWVASAVLKLAVYLIIFSALVVTLLHFASVIQFTSYGLAKPNEDSTKLHTDL